jgi:hypothetical protein
LLQIKPVPLSRIESGLQEAIKKHGNVINFVELLINTKASVNDHQSALEYFNLLNSSLTNTPKWLFKKAEIIRLSGNRQAAASAFQNVISAIKKLPEARRNVPAIVRLRRESEIAVQKLQS